jgi:hypothetical protein
MLTGLKGLTVIAVLGLGTLLVSAWIGDTWARRVVRVLGWAAVLAIGALGGWVFRAGWSEVSKVLQINAWVTPFDNFFIGLGAGMLLGAWMQDAWGDLKRIGAWAGRKLGFQ